MINLFEFPLAVSVAFGAVLLASAWVGTIVRSQRPIDEEVHQHQNILTAATMGLLSLVIGFTLSMGVNRYDLRKTYEAQEANAIGTEYVRIDLLSGGDHKKIKGLLSKYLDDRILFYVSRDEKNLSQIEDRTAQLRTAMWAAVSVPATKQPNPVAALAVAGMNAVLDNQGYVEAAWKNRLPVETWGLMLAIAVCANGLFAFGAPRTMSRLSKLAVLPIIISVSFFLIADIDSPRSGIIHVHPENLLDLAKSFRSSAGNP